MKIVMGRRCIETSRNVLPCKNGVNTWNCQCPVFANRLDAGVSVWRTDNLEVKHSLHGDIHGVMRISGDNGFAKGALQACTAGMAGFILFDRDDAMKRIIDCVIAGASAEVSLEAEGEIFLFLSRKACGGHNHSRGAKTTLIRLSAEERLLHRMECPVVGEPLQGGYFAAFRSESRNEAAMHGFAVEPYGTCSAIAAIAAFFDTKPTEIASESSQTLSRTRFSTKRLSIDFVVHTDSPVQAESSSRICSAK